MVSQGSITAMIVQVIIGIVLPLALLIYYRRTLNISYRAVGVGILVFIVFSQLLEKGLHVYMFSINQSTAGWLKNPWVLASYGALAAGFFEEAGRWLGFSFLLKKHRDRKDGIGVGVGHGGIEVLLISVVAGIQGIVFATMINAGTFEQNLGAGIPPEQIALLKERFILTPQLEYWLGAFERIPALFMQIALSIIVLYGVRARKVVFLLYAVFLHALIDFVPGLYQGKVLSLGIAECIVWAWGIGAVIVIVKSKIWFGKPAIRR